VIRRRTAVATGVVLLVAAGGALAVARGRSDSTTTVQAVVYAGGQQDNIAVVRSAERWIASARDLPAGSVTHVQPADGPGLFIVHAADDRFWALADRAPHRGEPLQYRDPLPGSQQQANGPRAGFYDPQAGAEHTLDGKPLQGPSPRALDPFPTVLSGDRLEVATHAFCPQNVDVPLPSWCGARW
jgi:hypothetical protein